ncbi:hypothetical protein MRX96_050543 [Rhipicephalus microplus]
MAVPSRDFVKRFQVKEIVCVQDFGAGKFEITFLNEDAVEWFRAKPEIFVGKEVVTFQHRGAHAMIVRVFGYLENCSDKHLVKALMQYGKVREIKEESMPVLESISTGVHRVLMEMEKAAPNIMVSGDQYITIEYDGAVRSSAAHDQQDPLTAAGGSTQPERGLCAKRPPEGGKPGGESRRGAELDQAEASPLLSTAEQRP